MGIKKRLRIVSVIKLASQLLFIYAMINFFCIIVIFLFSPNFTVFNFYRVFTPYLILPVLLMAPLLLLRPISHYKKAALIITWAVCLVQLLPNNAGTTLPVASNNPNATNLKVASWNIYKHNAQLSSVTDFIATKPADIIALIETNGEWLDNNSNLATLYPFQLSPNHGAPSGLVLLSAYPILSSQLSIDQNRYGMLWAEIDVKGVSTLVVVIHTPRPKMSSYCLALCFGITDRDTYIAGVKKLIDNLSSQHKPIILMGDFNLTDREAAYKNITSVLKDSFKETNNTGLNTWKSYPLMNSTMAVLRIDYIFYSGNIAPTSTHTDCTARGSDHCSIGANFIYP